jgi:hypothetical protein
LDYLDGEGWEILMPQLRDLERKGTALLEREVARDLASRLQGIGPKQSRNLLQMLGLSRYEVPLDSRVTKWLNSFGFPVRLTAVGLSDEAYYEFISDGFQELCRSAEVLPCLLDAAIFVSFDKSSYDETLVRW